MLSPPAPGSSSAGIEEPLPSPGLTMITSESAQEEQDPAARTQAAKPPKSDPGKVPKWLKLPGQDSKHTPEHCGH